MTDEQILNLLIECEFDTWAVAETMVDQDVVNGEYEGCSTDLEIAFSEYKHRAEEVLVNAGGR